jgi:hypothetical protein
VQVKKKRCVHGVHLLHRLYECESKSIRPRRVSRSGEETCPDILQLIPTFVCCRYQDWQRNGEAGRPRPVDIASLLPLLEFLPDALEVLSTTNLDSIRAKEANHVLRNGAKRVRHKTAKSLQGFKSLLNGLRLLIAYGNKTVRHVVLRLV